MYKIASNTKFILTATDNFKLYNIATLDLIGTIEANGYSSYNLHDKFLFIGYKTGELEAISLPSDNTTPVDSFKRQKFGEKKMKSKKSIVIEEEPSNNTVTAMFSKDSMLYAGFENGEIQVFVFNEHNFKQSKTYSHSCPIMGIASDNIAVFVSDQIDRIMEYPSRKTYDFKNPKLYFKKYFFFVEKNQVFLKSGNAVQMIYQAEEFIDNVIFSPCGGIAFIKTSKAVYCVDLNTSEIKGEYHSLTEFAIGKNTIIEYKKDGFNVTDTFFNDCEFSDVKLRPVSVKEKKVSGEEFDKKHLYVDDGNKVYLKKERKENIPSIKEYSSEEGDMEEKPRVKRSLRNLFSASEEDNGFVLKESKNIQQVFKNPKSVITDDGNLMYFSPEGYMISIRTSVNNLVTIKYHDVCNDTIEIKDQNDCMLGCFYSDKFVLSNRKMMNFNDEWTKEMNVDLLGMNNRNIFAFDGPILKIFNFVGDLIKEIFVGKPYTFCVDEFRMAIFMSGNVMIIEDINGMFQGSYVPVSDVSFSTFYLSDLYIKIDNSYFILKNNIFTKIFESTGTTMAIHDGNIITLNSENTILPKPSVMYHELNSTVAKVEEVKEIIETVKFNPFKK